MDVVRVTQFMDIKSHTRVLFKFKAGNTYISTTQLLCKINHDIK